MMATYSSLQPLNDSKDVTTLCTSKYYITIFPSTPCADSGQDADEKMQKTLH